MGAAYVDTRIEARDTNELENKYYEVFRQAQYDHGHAGYSGSFAEKSELEIISGDWDEESAAEHCENSNDKWGPAYAYHLGDNKWYVGGWCSE